MAHFKLHNKNQELKIVPKHFAGGGEGNLYRIQSPSELAPHFIVKLYHPHKLSAEREEKLKYLLQHPPIDFGPNQRQPSVVWVQDLVKNSSGQVIGFLMPLVRGDKLELLTSLRIPKKAASSWQRFAFGQAKADYYRLRLAFNIAVAIQQVHASDKYILVDLKPDNIIAQPNGIIALVDMDSVEVVENGESIFDAPVATPEYTPPEHYIKDQLSYDPTERQAWDRFSLAVIFYKLLFGIHPFAGANKPPYDNCLTLEQKIEAGLFVHAPNRSKFMAVIPPPHKKFEELDENLKTLFIQAFVDGHQNPEARPSAEEWCVELLRTIDDPQLNAVFGHLSLPTTPEDIEVKRRTASQIISIPNYAEKEAKRIIPDWFFKLQGDMDAEPKAQAVVSAINYVRFRKKGNGGFALFIGGIIVILYLLMFFGIPVLDLIGESIEGIFEFLEEFDSLGFYLGLGFFIAFVIGISRLTSFLNFLFSKEFKLKNKTKKSLILAKKRFYEIREKAIGFKQQLNFTDQLPEVDELIEENQKLLKAAEQEVQQADQRIVELVEKEEARYKALHQEYLEKAKAHPMLQHIQANSLSEIKTTLLKEKVNADAWQQAFDALDKILQDYKLAFKGLKEAFNADYKVILDETRARINNLQTQLQENELAKSKALEQRLASNVALEEVEKIKIDLDKSRLAVETLLNEQERYALINYKSFRKK